MTPLSEQERQDACRTLVHYLGSTPAGAAAQVTAIEPAKVRSLLMSVVHHENQTRDLINDLLAPPGPGPAEAVTDSPTD